MAVTTVVNHHHRTHQQVLLSVRQGSLLVMQWCQLVLWLKPPIADQKRRVFVCGHSLGAAMSTVFSRRAAAVVNAVYTFGCPRCGDTQWADSFPLSSVFRLVHNLDIVTHAPACVRPAFPYKHVGEMMLIDSLGQVHEGSAAHEGAQAVFDTFLTALHHPRVVQPNTVAKTLDQNAVTDHQPVYYAAFLWNQIVANSNDTNKDKKQ